jgi:hypothetical protein
VKRACSTSRTPGIGGRHARVRSGVLGSGTSAPYKTGSAGAPSVPGVTLDRTPVPTPTVEPVRFDTRVAVLLRDDLASWQRLNVTAFLVSGLTARWPELVGDPYADADGTAYLPMLGRPVMVFQGHRDVLTAARTRALSRDLPLTLFTADLFATGNDRDNRAAVRAVPGTDLDLVGLGVHGPRNAVDKVLKGARLHP